MEEVLRSNDPALLSFAADDQPEKAGDNLDLDAVLNLFRNLNRLKISKIN